ncbi:hypothetical protein GQ42DRAFT_179299 [Ramicandelaber brevisporus]|nr:hypothetical protein GQ42DRAFT_179299 [Ramicandelaber brevisporus]
MKVLLAAVAFCCSAGSVLSLRDSKHFPVFGWNTIDGLSCQAPTSNPNMPVVFQARQTTQCCGLHKGIAVSTDQCSYRGDISGRRQWALDYEACCRNEACETVAQCVDSTCSSVMPFSAKEAEARRTVNNYLGIPNEDGFPQLVDGGKCAMCCPAVNIKPEVREKNLPKCFVENETQLNRYKECCNPQPLPNDALILNEKTCPWGDSCCPARTAESRRKWPTPEGAYCLALKEDGVNFASVHECCNQGTTAVPTMSIPSTTTAPSSASRSAPSSAPSNGGHMCKPW